MPSTTAVRGLPRGRPATPNGPDSDEWLDSESRLRSSIVLPAQNPELAVTA